MALTTLAVPPLDPNILTGATRLLAGPARTGSVTLGSSYGTGGNAEFACWLYAGAAGDVSYVQWDGTTQTLVGLAPGMWHRIYSIQVNTTGTTATGLLWGS